MNVAGTIRRLVLAKNFGFIEVPGEGDYFFHKEDCTPQSLYTELIEGDKVTFLPDQTAKGPRARNVEKSEE
jgi:cold shock CspA family protein